MRISDWSSDVCSSDLAENLDLDVARIEDELLDEHAVVAEAVEAFALGRLKAFADVLLIISKAHPLAAAARRRLHHHRIADLVRDTHRMFGIVDLAHEAGNDRSEEHTSELQSLMRISYAVFGLKKKT